MKISKHSIIKEDSESPKIQFIRFKFKILNLYKIMFEKVCTLLEKLRNDKTKGK